MSNLQQIINIYLNTETAEITDVNGSTLYLQTQTVYYGSNALIKFTLSETDGTATSLGNGDYYFCLDTNYTHTSQPILEAFNRSFNTSTWASPSEGKVSCEVDFAGGDMSATIEGNTSVSCYCDLWHIPVNGDNMLLGHFPVNVHNVVALPPVEQSSESSSSSSEEYSSSSTSSSSSSSSSVGNSSSSSSSVGNSSSSSSVGNSSSSSSSSSSSESSSSSSIDSSSSSSTSSSSSESVGNSSSSSTSSSSSSEVRQCITAAGFGTTGCNGDYAIGGVIDGRDSWDKGDYQIRWWSSTSQWIIFDASGGPTVGRYEGGSISDAYPVGITWAVSAGSPPVGTTQWCSS